MAQEVDILKALMQRKKGSTLNKLVNASTRFESVKGLSHIAKHPELNRKIGKVGLKALQVGAQFFPYTKLGGKLINEISSLPRLLKLALPFVISGGATGITQFGIEKLNHKSNKEAVDQAFIDGENDIKYSLAGIGTKELFLHQLIKTKGIFSIPKKVDKEVINRVWPFLKTIAEQTFSHEQAQKYRRLENLIKKTNRVNNEK